MATIREMIRGMFDVIHRILNLLPTWVKRAMTPILAITSGIRTALEQGREWLSSQTAETITALIPGDMDESVRRSLLLFLDKVIPCLVKLEDKERTLGEKLLEYIKQLQELPTDAAHAQLSKLSSLLLAATDDEKLAQSDYDTLAQLAYTKRKKDN